MRGDPWHPESISKVVEKLEMKYAVRHPYNLPVQTRTGALYQPDICAFDKQTNELKLIIELETKHVRKSIMGAAVLAQICVREMSLKGKPKLLYILKDMSDQEAVRKLLVRLDKMRSMLKNDYLDESIEIISLDEFLKR
ncbi:MAG: hypothetical protein V1934_05645 [Methanobacteriota archaeon]